MWAVVKFILYSSDEGWTPLNNHFPYNTISNLFTNTHKLVEIIFRKQVAASFYVICFLMKLKNATTIITTTTTTTNNITTTYKLV